MKKIIFILPLFFLSCGTIKKVNEESLTTDNSTTDTNGFRNSNSFTLEPIALDKPILIGKDTIYNTRVIYNNTKEVINEKKVNSVEVQSDKKSKEVDYTPSIKYIVNVFFGFLLICFLLISLKSYLLK